MLKLIEEKMIYNNNNNNLIFDNRSFNVKRVFG